MARRVSDADHAVLDAKWHKAFGALNAAGLQSDANHPVAAAYRDASNAVNHANRSRDYSIATGMKENLGPSFSVKATRTMHTQGVESTQNPHWMGRQLPSAITRSEETR